jgi:hypothetical protein
MKINLNQMYLTLNGDPMLDEKGKQFTLRDAAIRAYSGDFPNEPKPTAEEAHKRYHFSLDIRNAGEMMDVTIEQLARIKETITKMFGIVIAGQTWDMLEKEDTGT